MTGKRWPALGLALLLLLSSMHAGRVLAATPKTPAKDPADASRPPRVLADAALLLDGRTGKVLFDKNGRRKMAPASTTKVMTAILAIERGNLEDVVQVSRRAASLSGSTMGLRAGQRYTLRELLAGLLLRSGNDAAVAIAERVGGSVEDFVDMMNDKAIDIGAVNTHFTNPHGLDNPNHYTTVEDMALMTRYAMRLPVFADLVGTKEQSVEPEDRKGEQILRNTNRLLWLYSWVDGVKTGTTGRAGQCLVASATRDGQRLIAVVFHSRNRWEDAVQLLDFGYKNFVSVHVASPGEQVETVRVRGGEVGRLPVVVGEELAVALPRRAGEVPVVQMQVEVDSVLNAPLYRGQLLGTVYALSDGKVVGHAPLVAAESVPRWTPWGAFMRFWREWFS